MSVERPPKTEESPGRRRPQPAESEPGQAPSSRADSILRLQRTVGNKAVEGWLQGGAPAPPQAAPEVAVQRHRTEAQRLNEVDKTVRGIQKKVGVLWGESQEDVQRPRSPGKSGR